MIKTTMVAQALVLAALSGVASAQSIDQYSLYGVTGVSLMDRSACLSVCLVGSAGQVRIGADAVADGDVNAIGTVFLADRGRVQGTLTTRDTVNRQYGSSIGLLRARTNVTLPTLAQKDVIPGSQDLNIYNGQTLNLLPGNWGTVHLYAGSKLQLQAGTYHFQQLVLEPDVSVTANLAGGDIDVRSNYFSFADRTKMTVVNGKEYQLSWYTSQSNSMYIGTDVVFRGILTAPTASIELASRTYIYGGLRAYYVGMQPDSRVLRVMKPQETNPVFTTTPYWTEIATGSPGLNLYCPKTLDPQGLPVTVALTKTVSGVTMLANGCVDFWTKRDQDNQYFDIQLTATNSAGYKAVQDFKIHTFPVDHYYLEIVKDVDTIRAGVPYVYTPSFLFCDDTIKQINTCNVDSVDRDGDTYLILDPTGTAATAGMVRRGRTYYWTPSASDYGKTYFFVSSIRVIATGRYDNITGYYHTLLIR
jgi:hypothetical protein